MSLTPKKRLLGAGGLTLFGTGGCLIWTIVLIPIALPMVLIGIVMTVTSFFIPTVAIVCPACSSPLRVERSVGVLVCPFCRTAIRRSGNAWMRVS